MNRIIVLENGFPKDVPEYLTEYLKDDLGITEWEHYDMRQRFWPENRKETFEFFNSLDSTDTIYCNTVFVDFQQLELMINLLDVLKTKNLTLKLQVYSLPKDFLKYLSKYESDITPDTKQYDDDPDLREKFKKEMNKKFVDVLANHNIYWIRTYKNEEFLFKSIQDIIDNLSEIGCELESIDENGYYKIKYQK